MISVIIPTYNRAELIGETLDSILAQTYSDWECIVVDDHSTDYTDEVMNVYLEKDKRFSYYKKPIDLPKGPSASRNYGLSKAKGDYINWLDSDDLMHPEKMSLDLQMLHSGDYDFTISQSKFFTKEGTAPAKEFWNKNLWSEEPINDFILKKIGWSVNSPLWMRKSLEKNSLSFEENIMTGDDYLYHIDALSKSFKPFIQDKVLTNLREHNLRLNNYTKKSPSKLKVFLKVLENKDQLHLNTITLEQIYELMLRQFSNLLKHKDLSNAEYFKVQLLEVLPDRHCKEIKRLYKSGLLFKVTGRFYSKLNVKL